MNQRLQLPGPLFLRVVLWLVVFTFCPLPAPCAALSFRLEVLGCDTTHSTVVVALPPESEPHSVQEPQLDPAEISQGVLQYLEKAERKETDPWLRDDLRIAWLTALYASRGEPWPHVLATEKILGLHPEKVWHAIVARRKAQLGSEYRLWYDEAGNALRPGEIPAPSLPATFSPKKPVRSVGLEGLRKTPPAQADGTAA